MGEVNMTYSQLRELVCNETSISKQIYISNFIFCDLEKMKSTQITLIRNIFGKYIVTKWLDYEYGQYEECKSFSDKDMAADFAWNLYCENNTNF